ncbi:hypothetical protein PVK06_028062 [Gossypium arboreum]|uniref:Uncharacterized protein n=1 Tax=Gossypium arboreum TaxID=29729 RepID=A0ABR0P1Y2_GOSAR|nr:hypothetical protein PVK06_028062 [Gossypium arboreum]
MFPIAKIWMQFIYTRVSLSLNTNTVNVFRAVLLFSILQCIDMFVKSQGGQNIQWLVRSSDRSKEKASEEEGEERSENSNYDEEDDEATEDDMPYQDNFFEIFSST